MIIKGLTIYAEGHTIPNGYLVIEKDKISKVGQGEFSFNEDVMNFPEGYKLVPGMIDVHIHGAGGADTMDATFEALETIATTLPAEGTTSFLATTITQEPKAIEKALVNAKEYIDKQTKGAEVLGIHLEGPFINKNKAGAQPKQYIINGDIDQFDKWQGLSGGNIKLVTMAPEVEGGLDFVRHLSEHGVVPSIGHSDATFNDVKEAVEAGARHVTHLFNGMSGLHHREPGVVGGALLHKELYAEMIVDGIHVRPETVDIAYRLKGKDRIILITDAMRAKCLKNGTYDLGGQDVYVKDGQATLANGALAGSVLKMDHGFRNMMSFTGADLEDVIQMGSVNPAVQLQVFDRKGSIKEGKDADLVVLNEQNEVVCTICRGKVAFEK
ncbi:MAG: N-acetylglucosamine-6-phosphate deacetylase [Tuberibacillus sp.]